MGPSGLRAPIPQGHRTRRPEFRLNWRSMKLHPIDVNAKCPHCSRGPLTFIGVFLKFGDKYRCSSCRGTVVHYKQKGTSRCGLAPVLACSVGRWKDNGCPAAVALASPIESGPTPLRAVP
jgi:hypothetical protein